MAFSPFALTAGEPSTVNEQTQQSTAVNAISSASIEIVVLDARVEESNLFLQDIAERRAQGRQILLLEISANEDGLGAISAALEKIRLSSNDVSAIHIISHGRDGEFDLGNRVISRSHWPV